MQIWLDTIDLTVISNALQQGLLYGITTTPSLLCEAPNPVTRITEILSITTGPLAVQVTEETCQLIVEQGRRLHLLSPRIFIKIPVVKEGWEAIRTLSSENIPVIATAIFHPTQALLAALNGALYVAPYFMRMLKTGDNPILQIEAMKKMFGHYKLPTKILATLPRTSEHIRACAEIGIEAVAIRQDLFADLIDTHELTAHAVEQFLDDWKQKVPAELVF